MTLDACGPPGRADSRVLPGSTGPILIIGTERSGSNLLRLVLNSHSGIAIPHPPHLVRYLAPIAASYGDLALEGNRRLLVADALTLLRVHIHPWEHPIDAERVLRESSPTVFGVVSAIYDQHRVAEGKRRWGCKSTFMVDHVEDVLAERADARFVLLVRDPRDVAASAKRSVFCHCDPRLTVGLWRRQQERGLAALDRHGPGVVHLLRYEDFVSRPQKEIERMCAFLGEPVEEAMLVHHDSPAARRIARLSESWRNAGKPISTASVGGHRRGLSPAERAQVEAVAEPVMAVLGYETGRGGPPVGVSSAAWVRLRELGLCARVEWRSLLHDDNVRLRWTRDTTVAWLRAKARARLAVSRTRLVGAQ